MTVLQLGLLASLSCLAASRSLGQAAALPFSIEKPWEEDAFRNSRSQEIPELDAPKDEDLEITAQRYQHLFKTFFFKASTIKRSRIGWST